MNEGQRSEAGMSTSTGYITGVNEGKVQVEKALKKAGADLAKARETGIPLEIEEAQNHFNACKRAQKVYNQKGNPELEKARGNVKNRIKKGIEQVKDAGLKELADHLTLQLRKGVKLSYIPDPDNAIDWVIEF